MNQPAKTTANGAVQRAEALRRKNLRLALVLASIVATFLAGFVAKIVLLSHP
jgi:hypothetical protein